VHVVVSFSADKDVNANLAPLLDLVTGDRSRIIATGSSNGRLMAAAELALRINAMDACSGSASGSALVVAEAGTGVEKAIELARSDYLDLKKEKPQELKTMTDPVVLVCGSFFVMGAVRAALGIEEPIDGPFKEAAMRSVEQEWVTGTDTSNNQVKADRK
jgi:folylpolyglutamate synthase/dihydropteroate synthase